MYKACRPGKDKMMDGDKKEVSSGEGYCKVYFPPEQEEIKAQDRPVRSFLSSFSPPLVLSLSSSLPLPPLPPLRLPHRGRVASASAPPTRCVPRRPARVRAHARGP